MAAKYDLMNFFVLLGKPADPTVRRIVVEQDLQNELTDEFRQQAGALMPAGVDEVEFTGSYSPEDGEVLYIDDFELPPQVAKAIEGPLTVEPLQVDDQTVWEMIRCFFAGRHAKAGNELIAQVFDRRRLMSKRFSIIMAGHTFSRLTDPGLILDNHAAAVFRDGRLYFQSFAEARRVFDLAKFYREATAVDIQKFTKHVLLDFEDAEKFTADADSWVRRKVALISDAKILERKSARQIADAARKYNLAIQVKAKRVVVPGAKPEMKKILQFLDENYFTSDLTGSKFISNSKRPA